MLSHPEGEALALRHREYLLSVVYDLTPPFNKQMQVNFHKMIFQEGKVWDHSLGFVRDP
jgi:hypothetical protein